MTNIGGRARREGGKQWTEEQARRELAACARSGMSIRAFAAHRGVRPKRLYWWMKRLGLVTIADATGQRPERMRRRGARTAESPTRFVPVVVKTSQATAPIVIRRDGATTMEIDGSAAVSPAWVAAVMVELERAACS